jgi:xanthine dehydrogenase YagS FAD-binding subunit
MNPFDLRVALDIDQALAALQPGQGRFIAGGTNLLDLMKERVTQAATLVDIHRLPLAEIAETPQGGLRLGALARNADTADHPLVRERYPMLRAAILAGASPQIRNMATNGGNLLQRTRCCYFYDASVPCNKRQPGSGCPASTGLARQHAILGASPHCIATHPSDLCVALAALDAVVHVQSASASRAIPFAEFHRLPGDQPQLDTTLRDDELITAIELPPAARYARHSCYLKLRERASYAFALVSVAAALELSDDGRTVRSALLALGGVAHKPWRDRRAEAALAGLPATPRSFESAAELLLAEARPWGGPGLPDAPPGNAFKIPLARRAIVRALEMAQAGAVSNTGEDGARLRAQPGRPS